MNEPQPARVKRETSSDQEKLRSYMELVRLWADRMDLVAPGDLEVFRDRHIRDSLRLVPLLEELPDGLAVDVGSGAGLPGIPLAIADPGRSWRLIEPRQKRAAFLEEVVRKLDLRCEIAAMTAEEAARDPAFEGVHVLATARALAPPEAAFSSLLPLLRGDGVGAVFVGRRAEIPPEAEEWREGIAIMRGSARH